MRQLIIIPAFNEAANISRFLSEIKMIAEEFDVIVINDGSWDDTSSICRKAGVPLLELPCNLGIGGAVQTGYRYAVLHNYDVVIQMDGDGQHDPLYLQALIRPIVNGTADMVIGSRFIEKEGFQSYYWRRTGIRFYSRLIYRLTGIQVTDPTSGFRAVSNKIAAYFAESYPIDFPEPESIVTLARQKFCIMEIPVKMRARQEGHSSIKGVKAVYYMVKVTLAILIDMLNGENMKKAQGINSGEKRA